MECVGVFSTVSKIMSVEQASPKSLADGNFNNRHKLIVSRHCYGKTSNRSLLFKQEAKDLLARSRLN